MMKNRTRREFVMDSAKITGTVIATATIGNKFLLPQTIEAAKVQFPEANCSGNKKFDRKILITYASEFGTTGEVAEAIGKILCREGNTVETKWVKHVKDLHNYSAVIIGSAIQYDRWMPEAIEFVTANQNILSKLPVAYFFTCLVLSKQTEKAEHRALAYSDKLYALVPQVKPISVGRFAGVLDYGKMPLGFRLIAKGIYIIFRVQEGDYRDRDAIRAWTKDVHSKLNLRITEKKS
jgi:menaquinone-dependent protoporphyrinogen oxidase